jgi:hypothetical protein
MRGDLYRSLGVDRHASAETVARAATERAFATHPDLAGSRRTRREHRRVLAAGRVLMDPDRRRAYDERCDRRAGRDGRRRARGWVRVVLAVLIPGVLIVASAAAMSVSSNRLATIWAEPATAIVRLASAQLMFAAFVLGAIVAFVPSRRMVRRDFLGVIIAGVASTPILMSAATTEMTDAATTASVITGALLLGAATVVGGATTRQVADTYARWRWARLVRMAEDGGHGILYIERAVHARERSRVLALDYATGGWVEEDLWGRAAPGFWQLVDRNRGVLLTQRVRVGQRDIAR